MKSRVEFKAEEKNLVIKIYGSIGSSFWDEENDIENGVKNVKDLEKLLKDNKTANTMDIYINSTGGSVFEGIAIYNILKRHKAYKKVYIDGFACSIASVIAMAGNQIIMPKSSLMMIHNAWTVGMGNSKEFRKLADDLEVINEMIINTYVAKPKVEKSEIIKLMDEESYLSAEECYKHGLCTKIIEDEEETVENVENALDETTKLFNNKLSQLEVIKNAIREIQNDVESEEVEETEETEVEETEETKPLEENKKNELIENAKEKESELKVNALKRFFNLERGKKEDE